MSSGWVLPGNVLRDAPHYAPRARELADLRLLLLDAYAPLTGFLGREDLASVAARHCLADGTPWPAAVTLELPDQIADALSTHAPGGRLLVLTDLEGAPIAALQVTELWRGRSGAYIAAGPVRSLTEGTHGPFRRLWLTPAEVRASLPTGRVLGLIADRPLHRPQLAQLALATRTLAGHLVVLIPSTPAAGSGLSAEALTRCVLAARDRLPSATVVAVPLAPHGDEIQDALLQARVAAAYGVTHLFSTDNSMLAGGTPRAVVPRELAYDSRDGQWRRRDDVPQRYRRLPLSCEEVDDLLDRGSPLPEWHTPPAVARELVRARPPRRHRGLVLFFTGLSGSGKSTIARDLTETLLETGERTMTVLDGDVVRRELSAGLGFSKADRDLNIRRIGWVAAEVARHGGMAICCPIAPYAAARATARQLAHDAGAGFVLIHVSTPVEVCAARDRKGLYAKAQAGQITGMTGVDDPYEAPTDAQLTIDTSNRSVPAATAEILEYLSTEGWIDPRR